VIRSLAAVSIVACLIGCSRHDDPLTLARAGVEVEQRVLWRSDPNVADEYGHTPLHLAVFQADVTLVRTVLAAGAKVDARDASDLTPLMVAAGAGACDVARALIAAGADVHAKTGPQQLQPVHLAALTGTPEMLGLLLEQGADASAADAWGRTPLHLLGPQDWTRVAAMSRRLADAGADLGAKDARGFTPLHLAAESDCVPMVDLYAARAPGLVGALSDTERNALDVALDYDSQLVADALFGLGVRPTDPTREPPLIRAARFDDRARADRVLGYRQHPVDTYEGHTASEVAGASGSAGVLALLNAYGHR
jgi:ankyrin repeat protein